MNKNKIINIPPISQQLEGKYIDMGLYSIYEPSSLMVALSSIPMEDVPLNWGEEDKD